MQAIALMTEYLTNPIGIGMRAPRLFWLCEGGLTQSAYRIVAEAADGRLLWDSGKVASSRMTHIPYGGAPLGSRARVTWRVKLWDETGAEGGWSAPARFELGLLEPGDWTARWITGNYRPSRRRRYPVDCFRRAFETRGGLVQARLTITACGLYEATLNGRRVGEAWFTPGFTDYRKRLQVQTYDVTGELRQGENALEVWLADGWFRGSNGAFGFTQVYGKETKLLCQLELCYADGAREVIASDERFAWSNDGPIRFADLKDGEIVDLARVPSYSGRARLTAFRIAPTPADNVEVRQHERFKPALIVTPAGQRVLDFGQNLAGTLELRLTARQGQRVLLRCGEILDAQGEFTQANLQIKRGARLTPLQQVELTCREGLNAYQMRFAVFGFRYILVETDVPFAPEDFTAIAVYSAMEQVGDFECSNPLVNRFVEAARWSMKGNFLDVPTDCPTRERAPWTGDVQVFFRAAGYLMDVAAFVRKWLRDLQDRQTRRGKVQCIVPSVGNERYTGPMDGSVGWADAMILVPYRAWKLYGDRRLLEELYPAMQRYAGFMIRRTGRTGILGKRVKMPHRKYTYNTGQHFGEWLEPRDVIVESIWCMIKPRPEEATAYLAWSMGHMVEIAEALGRPEDAALYRRYHEGAKAAYSAQFVQAAIEGERQAKLVRPLALGLLEGEVRQAVLARLVEVIERRGYRIGTGFLSTALILPVLSELGRADVAYRMLEQEEMPGWLYMVKHGATTVWENWDGSASRNHYAHGAVVEWLFATVAGISMGEAPGTFAIRPVPGGTLTHARATYRSVYGTVESGWRREAGELRVELSVPPNTTAELNLPDGTRQTLGAGRHVVVCPG